MLLDQYDVEKYVQATAARADMRVVWEDKAMPRTDNKAIYLPRITADTTEDQADELMAFVAHEVSHVLHTDFGLMTEHAIMPDKSMLGFIHNAIEDDNVDYINGQTFRGDADLISKVMGDKVQKLVPSMTKTIQSAQPEKKQFVDQTTSFFPWYTNLRNDTISGAGIAGDKLYAELSPEAKKFCDKLDKGGYADEVRKLRDIDDFRYRAEKVYDLAKRIFEEVYEQDPEKEEQRCKQMQQEQQGDGDGKGSGKGQGDKEGEGKGASGGKGDGEGEDGEGEGKGGKAKYGKSKGDPSESEFVDCDYEEMSMDFQPLKSNNGVRSGGMHLNYGKYKPSGHSYVPTPLNKTIVVDYKAKKSNHSGIGADESKGRDRQEYAAHATKAKDGFAQKVRMLLQIRSKGRTQYGTKQGTLHAGNLYRVTMKDAGKYSQHVFKKKITSDVLDTAVTVLCDTSGSMNGGKYAHTVIAAVQLSNTLGNTLHIPTEILGFTEHECRNTMFIHRDFGTKLLAPETLASRMAHAGDYMSQNCDGDSVVFAYNRLLAQKNKRKVLIVLSDGSPASSKDGDVYSYTQEVVKAIEKDKRVDIIGVGIMDRNVEAIYKHHEHIKSADEIETALLSLIEKKVFV